MRKGRRKKIDCLSVIDYYNYDTNTHTNKHHNSMTNPAKRAESVKKNIGKKNPVLFSKKKKHGLKKLLKKNGHKVFKLMRKKKCKLQTEGNKKIKMFSIF